jgi:hypothetical protein
MIKYLKHEEINFKLWDNCIENSINGYIYAYSWYLNIVAGEWDALVEDNYVRVFPLPYRKKYGIKYIYQPPFTQQLGLFSTALQGFAKLHEFILAIPNDFKLIEINLNKYYKGRIRKEYILKENINLELELTSEYKTIYAKYSKNLKRNLKKANNNELQLNKHVKPEDLIQLFKKNKGEELNVYSQDDYVKLGRLMYMLIHKGKAVIYGAMSHENNLLSAAIFLRDQQRYIFLFSGLCEEGKEKSAMPFLINEFIDENSQSQMIFDFEGSNNSSLARFYKSFGAQEYKYYGLRYYKFPFLINGLIKLLKKGN